MSKETALLGKRFGRLEVIAYDSVSKNGHTKWLCRCDCGKEMVKFGTNLRKAHTQSCGCLQKEQTSKAKTTHGMRHTKTYKTWCSMKERCLNSESTTYEGYGSEGITIYQPWIDSFEKFLEDMGERPEGTTLDRIDPHGNYEPSNCRWASASVQAYNKGLRVNNTSGKVGVSFNTKRSKWVASILHEGVKYYLGTFARLEDAIKARRDAELKYFGFYVKD